MPRTVQNFVEVLDEPSSPRTRSPAGRPGVCPYLEGYRGEINLAMEDWIGQVCGALERGFVLTIDYGELAEDLYSPRECARGTVVCFNRHAIGADPIPGHRAAGHHLPGGLHVADAAG